MRKTKMNNDKELLEKYGEIYTSMLVEGDGYYFYGYESSETFEFDPDLQLAFDMAVDTIEKFKQQLEQKIINEGGSPEDYEA
jgi:hypothetical protein